jgi:hypothetical protein
MYYTSFYSAFYSDYYASYYGQYYASVNDKSQKIRMRQAKLRGMRKNTPGGDPSGSGSS